MEQYTLKHSSKKLERYAKGFANHHRIEILMVLYDEKPGLTLEDISKRCDMNMKTASEHTRRLLHAGLLNKQYSGRFVVHTLSPYGKKIRQFFMTFSHS